ncbi:MAG TPA: bifunctional (p)ppGpp synthetase/guanosine-3',5'-bis(diphosphate) 3'-pyrophosphohydrolase [Chloroflexia bacterium]|nr:bifunctional (p)ppGpp synthetase/guanosine-3',5'-bis(diphosphate) 3'-pyrophosphohydrolase [Chloroflexia bacterium]
MEAVKKYLPPADWPIVERAVQFAIRAHSGQKRASGEPYVIHPIAAATTCAQMQLDRESIVAALLHDVPEDTDVTLEQIQHEFGDKVARLVDGVTKLSKIKWAPEDLNKAQHEKQEQAENLRKMFLAMVDDVRVVLIKLADRLHNMQTLQYKSPAKQVKIATETLEIFAPLANRLGIWHIKWQLEDLCFMYLHPQDYQDLVTALDDKRDSLERYLKKVKQVITKALAEAGITSIDVSGRPKHIYSIYKKMKRKNRPLDQIYDVLGMRIIVEDVRDCYGALGVIHTLWRPIPGEFDDYIANPKESLYQSLHTAVIALDARPLEVQIRTRDMHQVAEYGIAAHWRYKEGGKRDVEFEAKIAWLRRLLDWKDDNYDAQEFVDSLKSDVFQDQVYVFTPKGDIIDLPAGATPIDFAYRIHSDIGHQCGGARVNDRLVPLNYQLQNGEVVKIIQAKNRKGPSRDWLNPNLGYIKTASARDKIKQWFRREEREENIAHGRQSLDAELKRLGLDNIKYETVASYFPKYEKLEDFLAAIGYGGVSMAQVTGRLLEATRHAEVEELPEFLTPSSVSLTGAVIDKTSNVTSGVTVGGTGGLLTTIATCCHPMRGDDVVGYVTRTKGISVHRADCPNVLNLPEENKARLIRVEWGEDTVQYYRVPVRMEALDRVGLLRDIATLVADEKVNMGEFRTLPSSQRGVILILFTVEVTGLEQLARVLSKLHTVRDVMDVRRDVPTPASGRVGAEKK